MCRYAGVWSIANANQNTCRAEKHERVAAGDNVHPPYAKNVLVEDWRAKPKRAMIGSKRAILDFLPSCHCFISRCPRPSLGGLQESLQGFELCNRHKFLAKRLRHLR